jgi:hypothetical protein
MNRTPNPSTHVLGYDCFVLRTPESTHFAAPEFARCDGRAGNTDQINLPESLQGRHKSVDWNYTPTPYAVLTDSPRIFNLNPALTCWARIVTRSALPNRATPSLMGRYGHCAVLTGSPRIFNHAPSTHVLGYDCGALSRSGIVRLLA